MKYTNMKNSENIYKHDVQEKPINEKKGRYTGTRVPLGPVNLFG